MPDPKTQPDTRAVIGTRGDALTRVTTLRLPAELAEEVEFVARIDGKPVSEFIRDAIAAHLASRRADPEFQQRLEARIKADREILKRLEGCETTP